MESRHDRLHRLMNKRAESFRYTFDSEKLGGVIHLAFGTSDDGEQLPMTRINALCSDLPYTYWPSGHANIEKFSREVSLAHWQAATTNIDDLRKALGFNQEVLPQELYRRPWMDEDHMTTNLTGCDMTVNSGHEIVLQRLLTGGYMSAEQHQQASAVLQKFKQAAVPVAQAQYHGRMQLVGQGQRVDL